MKQSWGLLLLVLGFISPGIPVFAHGGMVHGESPLNQRLPFWPRFESAPGLVTLVDEGDTTAVYQVTFESFWSAESHPLNFPPSPHFSPLIGGSHHELVHFWSPVGLASPGIKSMAETGNISPLDQEVADAVGNGDAGAVFTGPGIPLSPGTVTMMIQVSRSFPAATLVSMIAPSPDWFVGVDGLRLYGTSQWLSEVVVDLYAYDAGTDSGASYVSVNEPTLPQEPIFMILEPPFEVDDEIPLVARFTFTLQ